MTIKSFPTLHYVAAASLPLLCALILSTSVSAPAMAQQQVIIVPPPIVCGQGTIPMNNGCMELTPQSFVAIAYHPDANDIWAAALYVNKESARNVAMAACETAMGVGGCGWTWQTQGGYLGVARGADGQIYSITDRKKKDVQKRLADACRVYELGCTQIGMFKHTDDFRSRSNRNAPDNIRMPKDIQNIRKGYAAAAWVTDKSFDKRFWVASGRATKQEAQDDAVALCKIQTNENPSCISTTVTGDGALLAFSKEGVNYSVIVEQSEARGRQAIAQQCKREGVVCTVHHVFDARTAGVFEKAFP
jgi:Domain of unknown function (DUF4189)